MLDLNASSPIYIRDFAYLSSTSRTQTIDRSNPPQSPDFADLLSGAMVNFYIGQDRKHWSLHRNLLQSRAPSFQCVAEDDVELADHGPEGFRLLVGWLYRGHLIGVEGLSDDEKYDYAVSCHELYRLCEKFDLVSLKNTAIDMYRQCLHEAQLVPDAEELGEIYSISPLNSPLRRLMVEIAARQIMDPETERDIKSYRNCIQADPDFAIELIMEIRKNSGGMLFDDPTASGHSSDHDHEDDDETLPIAQAGSVRQPGEDSVKTEKGRQRSDRVPPNTPNNVQPNASTDAISNVVGAPTEEKPRELDSNPVATSATDDSNHVETTRYQNTQTTTANIESSSPDAGQKPGAKTTPNNRNRSVQFKQVTPGGTPVKDWQPIEVSGMVKRYDSLNREAPHKKGPRKLRTSGRHRDSQSTFSGRNVTR